MKHLYPGKGTFFLALLILVFISNNSFGQIWDGAGINIPGDWNSWQNLPANGSPVGSEVQVNGGVRLITTGTRRYHATVPATLTGTTQFVFISTDNDGDPWNDPGFNKWGSVNPVNLNQMQSYTFSDGAGNNQLSTVNGRYYTTNWRDQGYVNTNAVWMETNNAPVTITSTSQLPLASNVTPSDNVIVTVNTSAALSPQEKVYIRYTTNSYATSSLVEATMVGNSGTAQIDAQVDGTTIQYYAFTSTATIVQISTNYDMFTLEAGGGGTYTSTALPPVNVTFRVDMANEVVSGSGVHLAGSFNGFNPGSTQLSLISGTVYGITLPLAQNSTIQYKFINGNTWGQDETVPGACNVGGNREFTIGNGNVTIPVHCYASCVTCVPKVPVKFSVNMSGLTVSGAGVHLAGDFGSAYPVWNPGGIQLTHEGGGIYSTTLMLIPNASYSYKYVNGNSWGSDEGVPGGCNVFGNRQVNVGGSALNIPVHCFGTCNNCVSVTFRVNMTGQTISGNGVHVAGSFQGWNPGGTPLTFVGGGIYEAVVKMDANTTFQYKFVNGNSWGNDEGVPGVCNVSGNRANSVGNSNKIISTVCFGRCIDCDATSNWTGSADQNFGNGNNWTAGVAPNGCNINVRIKSGVPQPILNGTASARNITFESGTNLNISSGQLNVCGDIIGGFSNVVVSGPGKLVLNGTTAQSFAGLLSVPNLELNNSSGFSMAAGSTIQILNSMKLQNGAFNAGLGNLKFISTPTSEARLLKTEAGASLIGDISFQKHLAGPFTGNGAWYFVGAPVGGVQLDEFAQGGNGFAPATYVPSNDNPASLYLYSQTSSAIDNPYGWVKANAGSQILGAGQGIRVWTKNVFLQEKGYYRFNGPVVNGTHTFTINYCGAGCSYPSGGSDNGWNLLANPYPCPIDWNVPTGWNKTGMSGNAIYIWNASLAQYSTYDGVVGTVGGSKDIAAGQAFFVQAANGGASLQVNENAKIDLYKAGMRTAVSNPVGIKIELASNNQKDDVWLDLGMERLDVAVSKLANPGLNLSLNGPSKSFAIAGKNTVESNGIIPIGIKGSNGASVIRLTKSEELEGYNVYLKDDVNGTLTELSATETEVTFTASAHDQTRFFLIVSPVVLSVKENAANGVLKTWPNPVKDQLYVDVANASSEFSIFNIAGKKLAEGRLESGQQSISTNSLPSGQYIIKMNGQTGKFVKW